MKRVWQVIDRERRSEGITARQMAKKLGMDPAHLSRLRTGQLRDLSADSLGSLLAGLRKSPELHTEVLAAYLADKLEGKRHLIPVRTTGLAVTSLGVAEDSPIYGAATPPGIEAACLAAGLNRRMAGVLGTLAARATTDRQLQALLISLADYTGEGTTPSTSDAFSGIASSPEADSR